MRHLWLVALLSGVALLLPGRATADSQVVTVSNYGPGVFNAMSVQPFDPALGTLDSVDVTIQGQINASVTQLICGLAPCSDFDVKIEQDFFGRSPAFFSFGTNALFDFTRIDANPVESYKYTFTFDAFADQIGFTLANFSPFGGADATQVIPPLDIIGSRASFLPTLVGLNELDNLLTVNAIGAAVGNYTDAGSVIIQYNYTPAPTPEPATLLLMAGGLGSLLARRRWRTNKNSPSSH